LADFHIAMQFSDGKIRRQKLCGSGKTISGLELLLKALTQDE